mmetsp:Transcript_37650/g.60722  ORF Transcript_37650/g.60722 Transcript_37650/m.60722 type:complete len:247 (+) Transcript_37650:3-743(+)
MYIQRGREKQCCCLFLLLHFKRRVPHLKPESAMAWLCCERFFSALALVALAVGWQRSFLGGGPTGPRPFLSTPPLAQGERCERSHVPPEAVARVSAPRGFSNADLGTLLFAVGVAAVVARSMPREDSCTTMFSKHDRRTFRGKLHGHTFGKYRLRKNKERRIQAVRNGDFDPATVQQQGQPEPEHCWDIQNLLENPMYYYPPLVRAAFQDIQDEAYEIQRGMWKERMGIKGPQHAYKNWVPPELVK